tara:strand:- start:599 stop:1111 length:513 start_codon:yes stop_codon:yes gene_type:complete
MGSIGDFAENLINEQLGSIKSGKQLPPSLGGGPTPAGKDIRDVVVPDSFMKQILGEDFHPQDTPATDKGIPELVWTEPEAVEEPKTPESLTEETAQQLVPLLEEVRDLLKEMGTTAGMMGVNLAGPGKDQESYEKMEKKYGYISSKPSKLPGDSRKSILKKSIRNKLKKK